jgi:HK97 family phage portal protein
MGVMDRIEGRGLQASVTWTPLDDRWYSEGPGGGSTFAGFPVSTDTAMRQSAVFACNSLILETVASLPCIMYRRLDNGGKERAKEHRLYRTVRYQPNAWMTAMDFYGYGQGHLGLRGIIVNEIRDNGRAVELLPLHPATTTVEQLGTGRVRVRHRDPKAGGAERILTQDQVLIVRDTSTDGIVGLARATLAREAISVAAAGEAMVGGWFRHDATGRLLITKPGAVPDETKRAEYRKMVQENYAGYQNASKAMILYGDTKAEELGKHDDSGFIIDPRKFQVADIARFWRVPLFMIGLEEKSTSWGTGIEQQKQGFVDFTIRPWLVRWEQSLARDLLTEPEQDEYFFEFLLDGLLRGDILSTVQALAVERANGALSPNEWRIIRNRNPRDDPGGDEYLETPTGGAPNAPAGGMRPPVPPPDDATDARAVPPALVADAAGRIAGEEVREVGKREAKAKDDGLKFMAWGRQFAADHKAQAARVLAPLAEAFGIKPWAVEEATRRIESTAVMALGADGPPAGWLEQRKDEVAAIIEETFRAAAAMRRAA